jgi:hypothetical protein
MSNGSRTTPFWTLAVVALPPLVLVGGTIVVLILGRLDANPLWPTHEITISEAAALRDSGTVAYLADAGKDLTAEYRVRAGLLDSAVEQWLTPAQAAIFADRTEIFGLLLEAGLPTNDRLAEEWVCLARSRNAREVLPFLLAQFPRAAGAPCAPGNRG